MKKTKKQVIVKHLKKDWYRYFFDILVVFFGIIIAFGLNNWKEDRFQRKAERIFLTDLMHDLTLDSIQLASMQVVDAERYRTQPLLLSYLREESTYTDSIVVYFQKQFDISITPFTPITTTIEEGKLSSGLSSLSDRQLRKAIVELYERYNFYGKSESIYLYKYNEIQKLIFPVLKDIRHPTLEEVSIFKNDPKFINMLQFNYGGGRYRDLILLPNQNAELLERIRAYIE